jgi:hypothetical protein
MGAGVASVAGTGSSSSSSATSSGPITSEGSLMYAAMRVMVKVRASLGPVRISNSPHAAERSRDV